MLALFAAFSISETQGGVVIRPNDPSKITFSPNRGTAPRLLKYVRRLGLVDVKRRTPTVEAESPHHHSAGLETTNGKLYAEGVGTQQPYLTSVTSSAFALIMPDPSIPESELIETATQLTIDWQPGT